MPAGDIRAGKEPEATLRRLCAAARTVELIAQPGEVRVFAWMVKRSREAGVRPCPRAPGGRRSAQEPTEATPYTYVSPYIYRTPAGEGDSSLT